jgi:hypothetical protein
MKEDDDNFNFEDDFGSTSEEKLGEKPENTSDMASSDEFNLEGNEFDESGESADSKPARSSGLVNFLKANFIFIIIGLIGVSVAGYMTYGILYPDQPPAQQVQQDQNKGFGLKPVVTPASQANDKSASTSAAQAGNNSKPLNAPAAQPTMPVMSAVQPNITMTQQDMKTLMEGFAKVVDHNSQAIFAQLQNLQVLVQDVGQASLAQQKQSAQVAATLNSMSQNMQTLSADLAAYNKNMIIVAQQLDKTQQQLALLLAEQTASVQKLTLRAVVPGRAWLVDEQGNTTTVTVGSELPNYGKVVDIDSDKSEVIMSTGFVFK